MKARLQPWCRPRARWAIGPDVPQHHRLPYRNLTRPGHRVSHGNAIAGNPKKRNEIPAKQQFILEGDTSAAPRTQDPAGAALLRDLEPCLAQLPHKQRDVLILVWLEEMSYEQAAGTLGISVSTVRTRLNLALEQLRRWLASVGDSAASRY